MFRLAPTADVDLVGDGHEAVHLSLALGAGHRFHPSSFMAFSRQVRTMAERVASVRFSTS